MEVYSTSLREYESRLLSKLCSIIVGDFVRQFEEIRRRLKDELTKQSSLVSWLWSESNTLREAALDSMRSYLKDVPVWSKAMLDAKLAEIHGQFPGLQALVKANVIAAAKVLSSVYATQAGFEEGFSLSVDLPDISALVHDCYIVSACFFLSRWPNSFVELTRNYSSETFVIYDQLERRISKKIKEYIPVEQIIDQLAESKNGLHIVVKKS
jgi:hypothetical protein